MKNIYGLSTALMFSLTGIIAKLIYNESSDINVFSLHMIINVISCLFFALILLFKRQKPQTLNVRSFALSCCNGGVLLLALANLFVLLSLRYIDSGINKIITSASPLFITLIYLTVFHNKPTARDIAVLMLMLLGLKGVVGGVSFDGSNVLLGIVLSIAASIAIAVYSVIAGRVQCDLDDISYWFYSFLGASVFLFPLAIYEGGLSSLAVLLQPNLIVPVALMALICYSIPYFTFLKSIDLVGAQRTNLLVALSSVFNILLARIFLNERLTLLQLLASGLIIGAIVLSSGED